MQGSGRRQCIFFASPLCETSHLDRDSKHMCMHAGSSTLLTSLVWLGFWWCASATPPGRPRTCGSLRSRPTPRDTALPCSPHTRTSRRRGWYPYRKPSPTLRTRTLRCRGQANLMWVLNEWNDVFLGSRDIQSMPSLKKRPTTTEPMSMCISKCERLWYCDHVCRGRKLCGAGKKHVRRLPLAQHAHDECEAYRDVISTQCSACFTV